MTRIIVITEQPNSDVVLTYEGENARSPQIVATDDDNMAIFDNVNDTIPYSVSPTGSDKIISVNHAIID